MLSHICYNHKYKYYIKINQQNFKLINVSIMHNVNLSQYIFNNSSTSDDFI